MKTLVELIKENSNVSDYRIITDKLEAYELYFVHNTLETIRAVDSKEISVTIYVDHKKYRGDSTFTVSNSDTEEDIISKINNAVSMASLINNKKYCLVGNETLKGEIKSNFNDYDIKALGEEIYNVIFECTEKSRAQINATEIFINKHFRHIENSQNLDKEEISYDAMIETIPTFNKRAKNDSVELYSQIHFNSFNKEAFASLINQDLRDVIARGKAVKPDYEIKAPVILRAKEISEIMQSIILELNYSTVYNESNLYKVKDAIQTKPEASLLKIKLVGSVEGSSGSHLFDSDGFNLTEKLVVNNGVVKSYYGSNQYAQYLHKKPTGNFNIINLSKGKYSERALKSEPYLECVSFSGLQVDLNNDYIGGEVRLANYYDGHKIRPVTGISISGKFSEVINTIKLSKKTLTDSNYTGPTIALLSKMNIF